MTDLRGLFTLLRVVWLPIAVYLGWQARREWRAERATRLLAEIDAANARIRAMDVPQAGKAADSSDRDAGADGLTEGEHDRPVG